MKKLLVPFCAIMACTMVSCGDDNKKGDDAADLAKQVCEYMVQCGVTGYTEETCNPKTDEQQPTGEQTKPICVDELKAYQECQLSAKCDDLKAQSSTACKDEMSAYSNCVMNAGKTDQGGTEQGGSEQGGSEQGGSEQGGSEQGGSEQGGTEQGGSEQGGTEQGGTEQGGSEQGGSEQGGSEQGGSEQGGKDYSNVTEEQFTAYFESLCEEEIEDAQNNEDPDDDDETMDSCLIGYNYMLDDQKDNYPDCLNDYMAAMMCSWDVDFENEEIEIVCASYADSLKNCYETKYIQ